MSAKSTQQIVDCLRYDKCMLAGDEKAIIAQMSRAQIMDLKTRGFAFGEVAHGRLVMVGGALPVDENPDGEAAGA